MSVHDTLEVIKFPEGVLDNSATILEDGSFLNLPSEILIEITSHLSIISRNNFVRSCKRVARVAAEHGLLTVHLTGLDPKQRRQLLGDEIICEMTFREFMDVPFCISKHETSRASGIFVCHLQQPVEVIPVIVTNYVDSSTIRNYFTAKGWQWTRVAARALIDQLVWWYYLDKASANEKPGDKEFLSRRALELYAAEPPIANISSIVRRATALLWGDSLMTLRDGGREVLEMVMK